MKSSVWSSYFIDLLPEEMVKAFSKAGWSASELSDEHAALLLQRSDARKAGKEFKEYADSYGFSFPQGHLLLSSDIAAINRRKIVDELKLWLELFNTIGIKAAVLHPGGGEMTSAGYGAEKIMEARVSALVELTEYIKGADLCICLENIYDTSPECEDLLSIIAAVDSPNLGICLDTGHLNITSGDQEGFIRKAGLHLKALHIADNEGKYDQHLMPYGRGTIEWDRVMISLRENNYNGLFNLEIPGERRCPMPVRMAKLDYLKQVVGYMLGDEE